MRPPLPLLLLLLSPPPLALASTIHATHYSGTLSSISVSGSALAGYALANISTQTTCGSQPSWLSYDYKQKTLYCVDEGWDRPVLSAYAVGGGSGGVTEVGKVPSTGSGVHSTFFGAGLDSFLAVAHYATSSVSTFALPLTATSTALQTFKFTMDAPGPNAARQDAPHIHQALLGPDAKFLVFADLGADLLRIYSVEDERGVLTSCANFSVAPGSGPRHGDWWVVPGVQKRDARGERWVGRERSVDVKVGTVGKRAAPGDEFLYIGNELSNNITVYAVSYPADRSCMVLEERQSISTYPGGVGPAGSKLGEVRVRGDTLTVSNRFDATFGPGIDSLTLFSISGGLLTYVNQTSSYGSFPRTFQFNAAGDLVAIGNEISATVAVVQRNPKTGELGKLVGTVPVGPPGDPKYGGSGGLSSVVWQEAVGW